MAVSCTCLVSILQLRHTEKLCFLFASTKLAVHFCFFLCLSYLKAKLNDTAIHDLLHKFLRQFIGAAKLRCLCIQSLLGLAIECWIDYQTVYEEPKVGLDLMRLNLQLFVLLLHCCKDLGDNLIRDVLNMRSTFASADRIHERDLLEGAIAQTTNDLPSVIFGFYNFRQLLVLLVAQVKICII